MASRLRNGAPQPGAAEVITAPPANHPARASPDTCVSCNDPAIGDNPWRALRRDPKPPAETVSFQGGPAAPNSTPLARDEAGRWCDAASSLCRRRRRRTPRVQIGTSGSAVILVIERPFGSASRRLPAGRAGVSLPDARQDALLQRRPLAFSRPPLDPGRRAFCCRRMRPRVTGSTLV